MSCALSDDGTGTHDARLSRALSTSAGAAIVCVELITHFHANVCMHASVCVRACVQVFVHKIPLRMHRNLKLVLI